jgi:D-alanyl-lipoteichoic acid acyltransferase DltB (MBOAT superfamily)
MRAGPRVLLALLGLALGLLLAEAVVRATGGRFCVDEPGVFLQADDALGWRQRPHVRGWATFCRGKSVPPTLVETDARGFLNPGRRRTGKAPGTARILLLGGNVPQALGVPWTLSMAGMLEQRADARRGMPLEVVNGAMGSFGLDQDLLLLRQEGAGVAPDLVLAVVDAVVEVASISPGLIGLAGSRAPAKRYFDVFDGGLVPLATPEPDPAAPANAPAHGPLARSALYRLVRGIPADVGLPQRWLPVQPLPTDHVAERERGERVLRAVLAALRAEAEALGARLALVVVPPPRAPRFGEVTPGHTLLTAAQDVGVPAASLTFAFRTAEDTIGNPGYIPDTTRFNADGHFLATNEIWAFLERQRLLPDGVVSIRAPAGGRVAPLAPFPDALLSALWMQRTGGVARIVAASLAGVLLVWLVAPLPARARDWATVGASLVPIALLTGTAGAGAALLVALAFWAAAEVPWAGVRRLLLGAVVAATVVVPLAWLARLPTDASVPIRLYVGFAVVMGLLRGLAFAASRARSRRRVRLVDHLVAMLFFPTFALGPIVSPRALRRARGEGGLAPDDARALGAHLGRAAAGAARVAWGAAKLVVAPLVLNLVTPDVLVSSGEAVGRLRLWAWLFETSLYYWIVYGGAADVGIGLAAMVGVRLPENFLAPWAATSPGAFWRRSMATVTTRFRRLVAVPVARRAGAAAGVSASFVAGALWYSITALALFGVFGTRPGAWAGLLLWAAIHTAGLLVVDRLRLDARGAGGRMAGAGATQLLVALAWVPFVAFPFGTVGTILRIYARLVGLR